MNTLDFNQILANYSAVVATVAAVVAVWPRGEKSDPSKKGLKVKHLTLKKPEVSVSDEDGSKKPANEHYQTDINDFWCSTQIKKTFAA